MSNQPIHLYSTCTNNKCKRRKKKPAIAYHYLVKCGWFKKPLPALKQIDIFEGVTV